MQRIAYTVPGSYSVDMNTDISTKVATFFQNYPVRTFSKRQVLINAEEIPTEVFYIVEGRVSQYDITTKGSEVIVNVFKPGAFFPMSSAINKAPNHYFFEANTTVKVHLAPADQVVQFLKDNPDVMFDLLARVYRGVDGVLRRMAHLMGGSARSRLVFELLNAAYRFGETQPDDSVHIRLSEGEIAKHSGLARETVNRGLQELKLAGLVGVTPKGIVIQSLERLETSLNTSL